MAVNIPIIIARIITLIIIPEEIIIVPNKIGKRKIAKTKRIAKLITAVIIPIKNLYMFFILF